MHMLKDLAQSQSTRWLAATFLAPLAIAAVLFAGITASAQTVDSATPAEEAVCDPLKADGVTKGLYGLCVAFCEAQDFADEDTPITEADLIALEQDAPSGRILANYNKKKSATDPDMPCILIEEPCPCWSLEELQSIDAERLTCDGVNRDQPAVLYDRIKKGRDLAAAVEKDFSCQLRLNFNSRERIIRRLSATGSNPTMTLGQYETCKADIAEQAAVLGLTCPGQ